MDMSKRDEAANKFTHYKVYVEYTFIVEEDHDHVLWMHQNILSLTWQQASKHNMIV